MKTKNLIFILIMTLMITIPVITTLILSSNHYEDELSNLKLENKKLEHKVQSLNYTIETISSGYECDCGWYQDFYYEHAEEVGAYE